MGRKEEEKAKEKGWFDMHDTEAADACVHQQEKRTAGVRRERQV